MRCWSFLVAAVLAVAPAGASLAAVTVFQDPTNVGTPGAPAAIVVAGGPSVSLNLFYQTGTTASSPLNTACLSGGGDEVCGWDIHITTSGPAVTLQSFTPNPGSDIVFAISADQRTLRANGGVPTVGELGTRRIGTLVVSATGVGTVTVSGNLFVSAALAAVPVTSGNVLANGTAGGDIDGDGVPDASDNCPTVANPGQEDGGTGGETGGPAFDGVGNACDNCSNANNPRVAGWTLATGSATYLASNQWATLTGGQRDDDHDGYGNFCDGDFNQSNTTTAADTSQYKVSVGDAKAEDTCGTAGNRPCAIFDLNSANSTESSAGGITAADTARYKLLVGSAPGPSCPTCPLTCEAGTAGTCF